jgi:hypothetical protein
MLPWIAPVGDSNYISEDRFGWIGFLMMIAGGVWLWNLNRDREN